MVKMSLQWSAEESEFLGQGRAEAMLLTAAEELGRLSALKPGLHSFKTTLDRRLNRVILEWQLEPTEGNGTSS